MTEKPIPRYSKKRVCKDCADGHPVLRIRFAEHDVLVAMSKQDKPLKDSYVGLVFGT